MQEWVNTYIFIKINLICEFIHRVHFHIVIKSSVYCIICFIHFSVRVPNLYIYVEIENIYFICWVKSKNGWRAFMQNVCFTCQRKIIEFIFAKLKKKT